MRAISIAIAIMMFVRSSASSEELADGVFKIEYTVPACADLSKMEALYDKLAADDLGAYASRALEMVGRKECSVLFKGQLVQLCPEQLGAFQPAIIRPVSRGACLYTVSAAVH